MKAARIDTYGQPQDIKLLDIDTPKPGAGQVLIEVYASSINPFDNTVLTGAVKDTIPLDLPVTLGIDVAGKVTEIGPGVKEFKIGDEVYGSAAAVAGGSGAFADYAVTSVNQLSFKPSSLDYLQAAAIALTGQSALQAISSLRLEPGQKILIHGGGGGIGSLAIQLAKNSGAYVATTATGEGLTLAKQLGADLVIDYKKQKFEELIKDYDAGLDTVAGETYLRSFQVLKAGGSIISMNAQPNQMLADKYRVTASFLSTKTSPGSLADLAEQIEKKGLRVNVDQVFSLNQIVLAFETWLKGGVKGKIVIDIKRS
jgi:alcohol dehydrogenase